VAWYEFYLVPDMKLYARSEVQRTVLLRESDEADAL
jgi:hypothetical protein